MESILLLIIGALSACVTFYFSTVLKLGPVRASALIALAVGALFYFVPTLGTEYLHQNIPVVVIGSTFIGMVSANQLSTYTGLATAGVLFVTIFLNTSKFFSGYGGTLGTSACIALLVVLSVPYMRNKRKLTIGWLQLRRLMVGKKPRVVPKRIIKKPF